MSRGRRAQRVVPLPSTDLDQLRRRVRALAENRPAVYQMFDATGRVLYVGKAKRLRTRLLTYFRASYPDDKAARILYAASEIRWDYVPSEFAAYLGELRQIRKLRPYFNHKGNHTRRSVLIKIAGGPAPAGVRRRDRGAGGRPLLRAVPIDGANAGSGAHPERSAGPAGLRRRRCRWCSPARGISSPSRARPAACGTSSDSAADPAPASSPSGIIGAGWTRRSRSWRAAPFSRSIGWWRQCRKRPSRAEFELAARWRSKFEQLEWLLAATSRARTAIDLLTFVYRDTGDFGDDRVYVLRRGVVRASFPYPATPIEHEAFRAVMAEEMQPAAATGRTATAGLDR